MLGSTQPELKIDEFKVYVSEFENVCNRISELCAKTNPLNFLPTQGEELRSAVYSADIYESLTDVNTKITSHMAAYEKLVESTGLVRLCGPPRDICNKVRSSVNCLHETMTDLKNGDTNSVNASAMTLKSLCEYWSKTSIKEFNSFKFD